MRPQDIKFEEWSVQKWLLVSGTALIIFLLSLASLTIGLRILFTAGEREVLEQSFQYNEARDTAIATYRAQLAETQARLNNMNLTDSERDSLNAQAARLRILIQTEENR